MKIWNCGQKGDQVGLSLWVWEGVCFLWEAADLMVEPPEALFESQMSFVSQSFHRFWSVEEFWDPLKPGDNDFHPQGHCRGPPPYWPLHCWPVVAPSVLLPWFWLVQQSTQKSSGSMSLFSLSLFSSLLPCSGSSRGLSKTIQFCHVAKSSWHPFSMLIRGQLWIFKMVPGASERQNRRDENDI